MPSALEYVILGHDKDSEGKTRRKLLLFNGVLPAHHPDYFVQLVELSPMRDAAGEACPALVLVDYDSARMLLAIIQPNGSRPHSFTEHYVFVPIDDLAESADQLERWLAFLPEVSQDINMTLPSLQPPEFTANEIDTRADHLAQVLAELPADSFEHVLTLLGGMMDSRPMLIANFPREFTRRLALVSGIQALLPGKLAGQMSFATQAPFSCQRAPQLVFVDEPADEAWIYDWEDPQIIDEVLDHPYIRLLRTLWQGDLPALAEAIQQLTALGQASDATGDLAVGLQQLADRFWVDRHVRDEEEVETAVIIRVLDGSSPPSPDLRQRYIKKLLQNALNDRDAAAGRRVAEELERDAELEQALADVMDQMLEDQPDAVYVFIRNRLIHLGMSERWIPRLQRAARNSLDVAVIDGDVGTVAGWLELIAHEPAAYQLEDVLRDGVLAATRRAWNDAELGIHLILIAARRVPDIVDQLYADEKLIAALETNVQKALQSASVESLAPLIEDKPEYFLLALYHGIKVSDALLVTVTTARRLWTLYESDEKVNLPAAYRASTIIRLLATQSSHQMTDEAMDLLFRQIVNGDDRQLITDAAQHLADRDLLFPRLGNALERDNAPVDKVLSIMNAVSNFKNAAPAAVIDTYFSLLDFYKWEAQTQRLMESLTRMMSKHYELQISYRHLWKLFETCHALQIEGATRVSVMHLLLQYAEEEELTTVVDGVARICREVHLSKSLREAVNTWWRDYTYSCNLAQMQRLERELDPQRHLETQKQILKTALAMRRWMQNRNPAQFTDMINIALMFIENITEAFDDGQLSEIDGRTIRREVDAIGVDLSSEQRHILANNLRNLATRITHMAEKRSKPSLIRSDESIEQQLTHGEANPHGSIDMLKWVAGYLDGAHPHRED